MRQHKLYFPCMKKREDKKVEMLPLSNVQMNTDSGTLHNREAERSTCKASILVFCWGPATESSATESSATTVGGTTDLYRNLPMWKIPYVCCPDKKQSKGRRSDYTKRRKSWNACAVTCSFRNVMSAHAGFIASSSSESGIVLESQFSKKNAFVPHNCKENPWLRKCEVNKAEIRLFRSSCLCISLVCSGLWLIKVLWKRRTSFHEQCWQDGSSLSLLVCNKIGDVFIGLKLPVFKVAKAFFCQSIFFHFPHPPRIAPLMR